MKKIDIKNKMDAKKYKYHNFQNEINRCDKEI